ncbi:MAG: alpha amylase C-terminal domain-containing protein [Deltaproteobacteria bacterium]|nr:alpha amylase C-terminal domain-containing protein [Deltaproteobacteria bacterium]
MSTDKSTRLLAIDPYLQPYEPIIRRRLAKVAATRQRLLAGGPRSLGDFAAGHLFYGLHFLEDEWVFREWAPNASEIYLLGELNHWRVDAAFALQRLNERGDWELRLPAAALGHGSLYRLHLRWPGGGGDRLPAYARRVVQDPETLIFNAQVWQPERPYEWRQEEFRPPDGGLLIYEAHVGMAQEEARIGTYREFSRRILPRIAAAGYNTVQLMAVQEHPYYGSFGYHVANFFAASSRFGTPDDLKELVDTAHGLGLAVVMDLVHSHAVRNEIEGLSRFDGTEYQYFHAGPRGYHQAWDSRCFDYGKPEVLHFLLSNCRFWLDEYRFDGFRFDGVTSMLYDHHGLGRAFTSYDDYFDDHLDEDALAYLTLANQMIHEVKPTAITMAEEVSGLPGLAVAVDDGGVGFDYRYAMGVPDYWIKLTKETPDEQWPMGHLWHELNNRRPGEKSISYAESHDQALVGDQTLIFRLIGAAIYNHMRVDDPHLAVDRGIALRKLIYLITLATAGHGYLNFMGNEFGHPEWIDFPREGNNWSYHYARRQWRLRDDPALRYHQLAAFDQEMIRLAGKFYLLERQDIQLLHEHNDDKVIIFRRAGLLFAFNFHPRISHNHYRFPAPPGRYRLILDSDRAAFGGHQRLPAAEEHLTLPAGGGRNHCLSLYLPTRTALVFRHLA